MNYFLFGIIADLYGKKKVIITLSILVFIFNGGIAIIANFDISKNFQKMALRKQLMKSKSNLKKRKL